MDYAQGMFLAGGGGTGSFTNLMYSTDGDTWTGLSGLSSSLNTIYIVRYLNNKWYAGGVGPSQHLFVSSDGFSWTGVTTTLTQIRDIYFNGSVFVAVGSSPSSGTIMTSPDGINWSTPSGTLITSAGHSISYYNGVWIAGGQGTPWRASYSLDNGVTWSGNTSLSTEHNVAAIGIAARDEYYLLAQDADIIQDENSNNLEIEH